MLRTSNFKHDKMDEPPCKKARVEDEVESSPAAVIAAAAAAAAPSATEPPQAATAASGSANVTNVPAATPGPAAATEMTVAAPAIAAPPKAQHLSDVDCGIVAFISADVPGFRGIVKQVRKETESTHDLEPRVPSAFSFMFPTRYHAVQPAKPALVPVQLCYP